MKFTDYIIAEDIRFETGNKFSVMGIYSDKVLLNLPSDTQWPIPFRFGIFVRLKIEETDVIPTRFLLEVDQDGNNIAQMNGNIEIHTKSVRTISLPLVLNPFPLPGYGAMRFKFEIYNKEDLLKSEIHELEISPA
jgi:hypothetical protein